MATHLLRLKRRRDFVAIAKFGRSAAMPGLVLQCSPPDAATARSASYVGLTASRRVGGAVDRNRARRRLRALADEVLPRSARCDRDYVLIARRSTLSRRYDDLKRDLDRALAKVGALLESRGPCR